MSSIHDDEEKINPVRNREGSQRPSVSNGVKQFINQLKSEQGKDILTVILIILVGLGSFELGRLSETDGNVSLNTTNDQNSDPNSNIQENDQVTTNSTPNKNEKIFFASSRGKKYYTIDCSAGKTIKPENKIYFTTGEEAQKAGYTLSSSCQ